MRCKSKVHLAKNRVYNAVVKQFSLSLSGVRMLVALGGVLVAYLCLQLSASCLATLYTGYVMCVHHSYQNILLTNLKKIYMCCYRYRGSARIAPLTIDEEDAPIIIDEEDAPITIDEEDAPITIDEEDAPIIIDEGENHELQPCTSDHSSDPPPSYEDPAPETTDTAAYVHLHCSGFHSIQSLLFFAHQYTQ